MAYIEHSFLLLVSFHLWANVLALFALGACVRRTHMFESGYLSLCDLFQHFNSSCLCCCCSVDVRARALYTLACFDFMLIKSYHIHFKTALLKLMNEYLTVERAIKSQSIVINYFVWWYVGGMGGGQPEHQHGKWIYFWTIVVAERVLNGTFCSLFTIWWTEWKVRERETIKTQIWMEINFRTRKTTI